MTKPVRLQLSRHAAMNQCADEAWQCETCDAPADEGSRYCLHCRLYWDDVSNGLFDWPELADTGETDG